MVDGGAYDAQKAYKDSLGFGRTRVYIFRRALEVGLLRKGGGVGVMLLFRRRRAAESQVLMVITNPNTSGNSSASLIKYSTCPSGSGLMRRAEDPASGRCKPLPKTPNPARALNPKHLEQLFCIPSRKKLEPQTPNLKHL